VNCYARYSKPQNSNTVLAPRPRRHEKNTPKKNNVPSTPTPLRSDAESVPVDITNGKQEADFGGGGFLSCRGFAVQCDTKGEQRPCLSSHRELRASIGNMNTAAIGGHDMVPIDWLLSAESIAPERLHGSLLEDPRAWEINTHFQPMSDHMSAKRFTGALTDVNDQVTSLLRHDRGTSRNGRLETHARGLPSDTITWRRHVFGRNSLRVRRWRDAAHLSMCCRPAIAN